MFRFFLIFTLFMTFVMQSEAISLKDYTPYEYKVLFTNPICEKVSYRRTVFSQDGERLYHKPKNVYCRSKDKKTSGQRDTSPQKQIIKWIEQRSTKEIFMTFLSFSDSTIEKALCRAVKERDVKLTFILDNPHPTLDRSYLPFQVTAAGFSAQESEILSVSKLKKAVKLLNCKASQPENNPVLYLRGNKYGFGYAHNKLIIINPNSGHKIQFSYGSANLSSGTTIHHENWHFVTTSVESYFAQSHLCLMKTKIEYGKQKRYFKPALKKCLENITAEEELDIKISYAPFDASTKATKLIITQMKKSDQVDVAAHRFSYKKVIQGLKDLLSNNGKVRIVVDDDMYWIKGRYGYGLGSNSKHEYNNLKSIMNVGAQAKFMQTNQWYAPRGDGTYSPTIHHNKYLIFSKNNKATAVFAGAGNFTGAAFTKNYENFYFIQIPEVVEKFEKQYKHVWNKLASTEGELPKKNARP